VYDRRGRLVRSVTRREPLYTEQDRAELLALAMYRDRLCPLHGGPLSECRATEDHLPDFEVSKNYCQAQVALIEAKSVASQSPSRYHGALLWSTRKRR
jgi:hypothetical protein